MEIKEKIGAVEAVLFAGGDPVTADRISDSCGIDVNTVPKIISLLNERYSDNDSGIRVKKLGNAYQMCTCEKFAVNVRKALDRKRSAPLSNASLEALAVIAYNQPVSKGFVESIRGTDSSAVISNLVEKGLIEEAGRLDVPGKPLTYRTTPVFLRCFGLSSLSDLPSLMGQRELKNDDERNGTDDST